ncbi:MAG: PAS domain-containing sensor histidine kinase [Alphaproteobacteria bacterium]
MFSTRLIRRFVGRWEKLSAEARSYALTHGMGGLAGLAGALMWAMLGAPRGALEWCVLVWLTSPLGLAALAFSVVPMRVLQMASSVNAVAILTGLAALSGGVASIFMPWLVLVPAEAALSRRPLALAVSMAAGAGSALVLASFAPDLPQFALPLPWHTGLMSASLVGCLLYAGMLALNVRSVHAKAAQALQRSEASYRFLADNAADLILRLSASGRVLYASPAAELLTGQTFSALTGVDFSSLILAEDVAKVQRAVIRAGYFGEELAIECRLRDAHGEPAWIELKCSPVHRAEPSSRRSSWRNLWRSQRSASQGMEIIAIGRDITVRHRHEEELKRAAELAESHSRAKSRFLANMSHELRTPLNSILGFSEMIAREMLGPLGNARYREYAGLIGESGQYLLNLINDILDVAKIEAGKFVLSPEPLNLAQTLERTLLVMMPQYREKGVELRVSVAPDLPLITADARAVRQILFNLLSNALKFTPPGGRAEVRLAHSGQEVLLDVADTGIGISEADLKRLARPFEQAANSYARAQTGTGLGLSLVKSLAALHGGALSIKSTLGKGTSVSVRLPTNGAAAQTPASGIAAAA